MKKIICHPIFYVLLQVLGIGIDGGLGIGFEMMALFVFSLGKNITQLNFSEKCCYIIIVEILIDTFCGNAAIIFETAFWIIEEVFTLRPLRYQK